MIGSTGTVKYELREGNPVLTKTTEYVFVNDKEGKPAGIHQHIGRRPVMCVGNSDGDQAMLEYTTVGNPRPSLGVLIHHTDGEREYRYDAEPPATGKLVSALQAAKPNAWIVVDMRLDWNKVFADKPGRAAITKASKPLLQKRLQDSVASAGRWAHRTRGEWTPMADQKKPNIVMIMADDVGTWNLSAYHRGMMGGSTPNIDRIAREGALFTDYYGQRSCTAGRAAFILGQTPFRTGLLKVGMPAAKQGL